MRIICLDDHPIMLDSLVRELNILAPGESVSAFQDPQTTVEFAQENGCDIFFCEIDLRGSDGVIVAEKMQEINPRVNIIFTTVCEEVERAKEIFRLHPSGYITKPYTQEQLARELRNLRYKIDQRFSGYERPMPPLQDSYYRYDRAYDRDSNPVCCGEFSARPGYMERGSNMRDMDYPRGGWNAPSYGGEWAAAAPGCRQPAPQETPAVKPVREEAAPAAEEPKAESGKAPKAQEGQSATINSKDLRRLSRAELLEVLITQTKEFNEVKLKLEECEDKLNSRELSVKKAGSIAEASLQINGVFEAAQKAAEQYLENIRIQAAEHARRELELQERLDAMLAETEAKCSVMESETAIKCEEMTRKAEIETKMRWDELHGKMEAYMREHEQLRSLLALSAGFGK